MRSRVVGPLLAALWAIALGSSPAGQTKPIWARNSPLPKGLNPGDTFPTLALPSAVDGRPVSVAEFRGRKLLVNIFASW